MTEAERADLIDLYVDGELPEALLGFTETCFSAHPDAAKEAAALQSVSQRLHAVPAEQPDGWFVERALDRLLREHAAASQSETDLMIHPY